MKMSASRWKYLLACCAVAPLLTSCVSAPVQSSHDRHAVVIGPELLKRLELKPLADLANEAIPSAPNVDVVRAAPAFTLSSVSEDNRSRARACLTAAIYYEARSESADGQRAVAQVVLNRVRDRAFPNSVCGVVYQGASRRTGCQFSFTCDGSTYRAREPGAWVRAESIADQALDGRVYASVGSATFYHANTVDPWWSSSLSRIGSIGAHIFYRWRTALDRTLAFHQSYSGIEPLAPQGSPGQTMAEHLSADAEEAGAGVLVHRGSAGSGFIPTSNYGDESVATVAAVTIHRGMTRDGSKVNVHLGSDIQTAIPSAGGSPLTSES